MAVLRKFNCLSRDLANGVHNFASNTFKIMLSDTAPELSDAVIADMTEIASGGSTGYTAGGTAMTVTSTLTGAVEKISAADVTFTGGTAGFGPFRYAVMYNATASGSPLICWWDYGAEITAANTEQIVVVFDATNGILQIS
jgi:hypothetical protein